MIRIGRGKVFLFFDFFSRFGFGWVWCELVQSFLRHFVRCRLQFYCFVRQMRCVTHANIYKRINRADIECQFEILCVAVCSMWMMMHTPNDGAVEWENRRLEQEVEEEKAIWYWSERRAGEGWVWVREVEKENLFVRAITMICRSFQFCETFSTTCNQCRHRKQYSFDSGSSNRFCAKAENRWYQHSNTVARRTHTQRVT